MRTPCQRRNTARHVVLNPKLVFFLMMLLVIGGAIAVAPSPATAGIANAASNFVGWREGTARLNRLIGANSRRTRWCALFVKSMYIRSGKKPPTLSGQVSGWDSGKVGRVVSSPQKGDIAYFRHSHIAIVVGVSKGKVCTISGNRRNQVTKSCEARKRFKRFRRPA